MPDGANQFTDERIDSLVRSFLLNECQRVDVSAQLLAIQRRLDSMKVAPPAVRRSRAFGVRVSWVVSVAATLLLAFIGLQLCMSPAASSAASIVGVAREAFAPQDNHCYRVQVKVPPAWLRGQPLLNIGPNARLWTREDSFCVIDDRDGGTIVWGQDEARNVWFACPDGYGLEFNEGETPPAIKMSRSFLHLDMARLMTRFLNSFDLSIEDDASKLDPNLLVIRATAKPDQGRVQLNAARVVIDRRTHAIRQLQLSRNVGGSTVGTVTFTLLDGESQLGVSYRLQGHLPAEAEVYRGEQASARFQQLKETLRK